MAQNLDEFWKKNFVPPVSVILIIAGLFILGRDLLRMIHSFMWSTQLATTTTTGGLVQQRVIALIEDYPLKFGSFNWLVGGLVAALGLVGLLMSRKYGTKK